MSNLYPPGFLELLDQADGPVLDNGAGGRSHPRITSLEITAHPNNSVRGDALNLPFRDDTFALVLSQAVLEHVTDPRALAARLDGLLAPDGLMLVSTLVSDGQLAPGKPLTWWYAAPRNGHVSLYSRTSLDMLATKQGWRFASFSPESHVFWRGEFPAFARHLLAPGQ